jgi:DUF438 domain-containing protein
MIYKEEHILYPASLDMLTDPEWIKVKEGEADIGFAWVVPNTGWPENLIQEMLTHLPVDLTFVDENDRVAYYSEGPERIFPRSPAIIGREVRNCHPPKSVHLVNQILDAFKSGSRDTAEFWIELGGKFIYIRYFAVRDADGYYRGCLEVSQDLTQIRKLEGQQRLLDWE